jgi:hypothetical protein
MSHSSKNRVIVSSDDEEELPTIAYITCYRKRKDTEVNPQDGWSLYNIRETKKIEQIDIDGLQDVESWLEGVSQGSLELLYSKSGPEMKKKRHHHHHLILLRRRHQHLLILMTNPRARRMFWKKTTRRLVEFAQLNKE